jgi:hypothetical protein
MNLKLTKGLFTKDVFQGVGEEVKKCVVCMGEQERNEEKREGGVSDFSIQMLQDVLCKPP